MTNPKSIAFYGSILTVTLPNHAASRFNGLVVVIGAGVSLG